jgi:adenine specific DNA methylase Mod
LSSADYSFQLTVEGQNIDKEASIIERLAYTDTWEGGIDSFLDMIYPRIQLMKRLLSDKGNIFFHIDWHTSHYIKILLDEVFGYEKLRNEIIWQRMTPKGLANKRLAQNHDVVFKI